MEPCQQIKWAGNWYRRNVRLGVNWARYSLGYKQGVLSNLGNSLPLLGVLYMYGLHISKSNRLGGSNLSAIFEA